MAACAVMLCGLLPDVAATQVVGIARDPGVELVDGDLKRLTNPLPDTVVSSPDPP